ncbi:MAG TPA: hypothetical protein VGP36_18340 [Mycobacteriales bacterium]|nr:hypothetical protein [Mycobacteriales bacterium]
MSTGYPGQPAYANQAARRIAGTPTVSVRKISSSSPGTAPKMPVPIEPIR